MCIYTVSCVYMYTVYSVYIYIYIYVHIFPSRFPMGSPIFVGFNPGLELPAMAAWQTIHSLVTCVSTVVGDFYPSKKWSEFGIRLEITLFRRHHFLWYFAGLLIVCRSLAPSWTFERILDPCKCSWWGYIMSNLNLGWSSPPRERNISMYISIDGKTSK